MEHKPIPRLAVFTYAFPHHRSNDFLQEIASWSSDEVIVLAAPWRKIENRSDAKPGFERSFRRVPAISTSAVCKALNFKYFEVNHDNFEVIKSLTEDYFLNFGIIAGARIIKSNIINLFPGGVINIHPGKIPETSGLDSFYYSIKKGVALGATAHFIDSLVDAGRFLDFVETKIGINDSIEMVQLNNTQSELIALRRVLQKLSECRLDSTLISRPAKNMPMSNEERELAISKFADWRVRIFIEQIKADLFIGCEEGNVEKISKIISNFPFLLEARNYKGWTPLIVSSFNQQLQVVKFLLGAGADPNAAGFKGTTPLMYAKTKLIGCQDADYRLLETLIVNGARVNYVDSFGKSILDYVETAGDVQMLKWLHGLNKKHC
jgi:folate-dependent phosphoribosylglycinamide formyltransferase PurN